MDYDVKIWMPLFCDRFLRETDDMTAEETGAYSRLMVKMWLNEGHLPSDPVYLRQVCRVSEYKFPKIWEKIGKYFQNISGIITNNFMLEAYAKAVKNKESYVERARKGGIAKRDKEKFCASGSASSIHQEGKGSVKGKNNSFNRENDIGEYDAGRDL